MMLQETTEIVEVDLEYEILQDIEEKTVTLKFRNFDDEDQMKRFQIFMIESLPLLLFDSEVKH
jgi:hypothetical protein